MILKRCPFCNSHDLILFILNVNYAIHCLDCNAYGPSGCSIISATEFWNGEHTLSNKSAMVCERTGSNRNDVKDVEI